MSGSKLALHVLPGPADVDALIRSAPWACVKAVNGTRRLAVAAAAGIPHRLLRDTATDAMGSADAVSRLLSYDLTAVTAIQCCCESGRGFDPVWQTEVVTGLRARGFGGTILVGGFATGNPTQIAPTPQGPHFPELEPLYPLLRCPGVALALDAYSGILPADPRWAAWAPYTAQRHRLILADLARQGIVVPVYITESGGDNANPATTGGGWATRGWSPADYLGLLTTLDAGDQADAGLVCRCVFTSAPTPDWAGYDLAPIAPALAAYVATQAGNGLPVRQDGPGSPIAPKEAIVDYASAVWAPSPNYWPGRSGMAISAVVLHATAGGGSVQWFANPASQVSAHYVVDVDGTVTQCVSESDSAWANGIVGAGGIFPAEPNPNYFTLSVESVRDVTNTSPITAAQLASGLSLVADMLRRHPTITTIIGHDSIQPGRICPGPGFPLAQYQALLKGTGNVDDLYEMQWKSYKGDTAVNTSAAIYKDWLAKRQAGDHSYGVPTTQEFPHGSGVAQIFTGGLATWDATNGVQWH